jgi:hypothetical protein
MLYAYKGWKVSFSDGIAQSATLTWLNVAWSGGQLQGTWIGLPSPPFIAPSQLPVPEDRSFWVSKSVVLVQRGNESLTSWILACGEAKLGC